MPTEGIEGIYAVEWVWVSIREVKVKRAKTDPIYL